MSEGALWKEIRPMLKRPNLHASRVESHSTSAGIPDVNICWDSVEFNIELKFGNNKKPPKMRDTQVRWINKRIRVGGKVIILAKLVIDGEDYYMFYRGKEASRLYKCKTSKEWLKITGIRIRSLDKEALMACITTLIS